MPATPRKKIRSSRIIDDRIVVAVVPKLSLPGF